MYSKKKEIEAVTNVFHASNFKLPV